MITGKEVKNIITKFGKTYSSYRGFIPRLFGSISEPMSEMIKFANSLPEGEVSEENVSKLNEI